MASSMGNSKFLMFIGALYMTLFIRWTIKALSHLPLQADKDIVQLRDIDRRTVVSRGPTISSNINTTDITKTVVIMGYGKFGIHKYPIHCDCGGAKYLVTNESVHMQTAQIVVFTVGAQRNMTLDDWRKYHRERKQSQVWVLGTRESPQTCTAVLPPPDMGMVYNWSFTYHSKADFPTPYGGYKAFRGQQFGSTNWFSQKKNLITWTSSHCPLPASRYRRRDFVYSLKNHLNISMYGTCGDGRFDGPNYSEMMKSYKFALVLENSCCSEYITEKFWDALTVYNQVPVVYGANREEYEKIAPPGSFIFIQDFSSLKELAEFIEKVGNSEFEYNKYHYWRRLGHAYKQNDQEDRMYHCHSICRMASKQKEVEEGKMFHFDEKGEVFSGGCRQCQKEIDLVTGNVS